ncbi:MAG: primosomal protein N' [Gilvibacter sp.]
MYFIDVILPIPIKQAFTYSVNAHEAHFLSPGFRVAVPFGKSKIYTGIVLAIHQTPPQGYETKEIDQILDQYPIVTDQQLSFWQWMASYYMCAIGEVVRAALPGAFLLESETTLIKKAAVQITDNALSDDEFTVYEALEHRTQLTIHDVRSLLDKPNVMTVVKGLIQKDIISVHETVYEQYVPKKVAFVSLATQYKEEENLRELLDHMSRAPKQKELLMHLFVLEAGSEQAITSKQLLEKAQGSTAVLKALVDKGIVVKESKQVDRIDYTGAAGEDSQNLNTAQQEALAQTQAFLEQGQIVLLHGVTSSGKTELYVKLIEQALERGEQVLYMLPEIALTTQLISRLQVYFGERVSVYHSRYSVHERIEVWNNVLQNQKKAQLIVGARSSLFLPFANLGLCIVDEEHEPSFKQYNPAPRYHARDAVIMLANQIGAKVLLGSATPSLESYFNAKHGKYGLVELKERFGNVLMPEISLVDLKEKQRKKRMEGHFSDTLKEAIQETLQNQEQVILFQNRRGFSPIVECLTCGTAPQCPNCDVSLTYHKHRDQLRCHYCGYNMAMTLDCLACGSPTLDPKGFGTEQIEIEARELFPEVSIARMDQDTMRAKHAHAKLIEAFEQEEVQILIGTQMLAKGLDFRKVGLVGVLKADSLLNFPDFRAHERSFQLLSQVAGRAGRTQKRGLVLIQTYNPYHQILQQVSQHNYEAMYEQELEDRYQFKYSPYHRSVRITFKHRNLNNLQKGSYWFAKALQQLFGEAVLGPEAPPVGRIRNEYISNVLLKIGANQSLAKSKQGVLKVQRSFFAIKEFARIKVILDVDPY